MQVSEIPMMNTHGHDWHDWHDWQRMHHQGILQICKQDHASALWAAKGRQ